MKAIKRELRRIKYFYQFQDVEVRIFLLLISKKWWLKKKSDNNAILHLQTIRLLLLLNH